jgi:hypothetical protein
VVEKLGIALELIEWWRNWELHWSYESGGGTANCIGVKRVVEELGITLQLIVWWRKRELQWS